MSKAGLRPRTWHARMDCFKTSSLYENIRGDEVLSREEYCTNRMGFGRRFSVKAYCEVNWTTNENTLNRFRAEDLVIRCVEDFDAGVWDGNGDVASITGRHKGLFDAEILCSKLSYEFLKIKIAEKGALKIEFQEAHSFQKSGNDRFQAASPHPQILLDDTYFYDCFLRQYDESNERDRVWPYDTMHSEISALRLPAKDT